MATPLDAERIQRFLERVATEDSDDINAIFDIGRVLARFQDSEARASRFTTENAELRRKMAFLEERTRDRLHGLIDVFLSPQPRDED